MPQQKDIKDIEIKIQRGFFDNSKRQLTISPEYTEFEEKNLRSAPLTRFNKNEITDCRFGVKWHSGIYFMIGREFKIFLRNRDKQVLEINFNSYLGIKKKELGELYVQIVKKLWEFYFTDITSDLLSKFKSGEDIQVGEAKISREGITIKTGGIITEKDKTIPWGKVGIRNYNTYFAIYSTEDSASINKGFSYLDNWNTLVLSNVVQTILATKNN